MSTGVYMIDDIIDEILSGPGTRDDTETRDRRRPGRPVHVSPRLIGLLRGDFAAHPPFSEDVQLQNPLSTARGLVFGTVLGLLIWVGSYFLATYLLG